MPDPNARPWFINVAQLFSNTSKEFDYVGHARRLGISDIQELIGCLADTTSSTARQITKLLYTPQQLLTMSGTKIPASQRKAICEAAEAHKGPINKHLLNEAINGVFRSKKSEIEKKKNGISKKKTMVKEVKEKPGHRSSLKTTNQELVTHLID